MNLSVGIVGLPNVGKLTLLNFTYTKSVLQYFYMRLLDLSKIVIKHKKGWIALAPNNTFLATGTTLKEVLRRSKAKGITNPTVFKSPRVERLFAG